MRHKTDSSRSAAPGATGGLTTSALPARCGLTLIDVTISVLIIGILAAVAAPKFTASLRRYQLEAAAKTVEADLKYARQHAKTKGKSQSVVFTVAGSSYQLTGADDVHHPGQPFVVNLTETENPATIVSASFGASGTADTIVFDMHGRPDFAGSVTISVNGQQRTIAIDSTGNTSIQP